MVSNCICWLLVYDRYLKDVLVFFQRAKETRSLIFRQIDVLARISHAY